MNRWAGVVAAVSVLALTAACNSDNSASSSAGDGAAKPTPKPTPAGPPTVTIKGNKVSPSTLEVGTGATVTIRNNDSVGHRLDDRAEHIYSGTIPAKSKGELTVPPDPGTYTFIDPNNSSVRLKVPAR